MIKPPLYPVLLLLVLLCQTAYCVDEEASNTCTQVFFSSQATIDYVKLILWLDFVLNPVNGDSCMTDTNS